VIQIESITMKDVRGIRDLTLEFDHKSFVVSGPNGSGKSGVVDAIEFCLTGEISRLSGKGTAGVTLQKHGPHVDRRDDPAAAEVTIRLNVLELGKTATISRNMKKPKVLRIEPNESDIRTAVEDIANHPELVLSRREIIKYVLAEAGERSKEVQALLRLERIGQIRSTLGTAHNKLKIAKDQGTQDRTDALEALKRHLDIEVASQENILAAVNERRKSLGLSEFGELTEHTILDAGVLAGAVAGFNKESALRDVAALAAIVDEPEALASEAASKLKEDIEAIDADASLLQLVQRADFIEKGLGYVDSEFCPLCDLEWSDAAALRAHLEDKLVRSAAAGERRESILQNAGVLAHAARRVRSLGAPVVVLAESESSKDLGGSLKGWADDLEGFATGITTLDGALAVKDRLDHGWLELPGGLADHIKSLEATLKAKPDQTATVNAQTFLTRAQDRYTEYRSKRQLAAAAAKAEAAALGAYDAYCAVSEESLSAMYESVQEDFSLFYREINAGDEAGFKARLEQGAAKLELSVDFYGLGMYPPGAYHSEGHQDGMGVCLYLALMKRLFGDQFRFAVLDDVVMSIDRGHRKQFCRLLREHFPDTQFIITTHDAIWARQMRTEGLIDAKGSVEFHGWSVETGPIFEPVSEVWERIEADLARNDIPAAAARLRRHLEYTSTELADLLAAQIPFRGDAGYDLGELFNAVVGRQRELLGLAASAANSWNKDDDKEKVEQLKEQRKAALAKYGDEQWVVNKAVHYNEWAEFSKADFTGVVEAVRALLEQFRCPACESWLYPSPPRDPEALRCRCGSINLNLKKK
jgi:recombinational DNA repair ATPase RecF